MKRFRTLFVVEWKLAMRSFDSVVFGLIMPLIILLLVGYIFRERELENGLLMLNSTLGAFLSIGICAYGLMALPLVLANYRSRKILKRLQVTPVSPLILLLVQVAIQASMSLLSAGLVFLLARTLFQVRIEGSIWELAIAFLLLMGAVLSMGLTIASTAKDEKKAGIWCSLFYFPMLLLSGTTIPYPVLPGFLQKAAQLLPLRLGIEMLNGIVLGQSFLQYSFSIILLALVTVVGVFISVKTFRWDMQINR